MTELPIKIGDSFRFRKTVSESDVYLFAGISGDLSPNHLDEEAMKSSAYGGRIAHGALLVSYMSACSTMACEKARESEWGIPVSLGYDKVRFLKGVCIGETIQVDYAYADFDPARARSVANVKITVAGTLVAVADHIMTWVKN
ncbi:MaoC family dehydratase [Paracoccus thiocyanatus]|uniref:Dehydratase n=1 Tax=Paracoccus thiocyanatus TaxID=34006 RepID=A0A3D8PHK9_9RHOB|nr:MaoC/PaaZ C-terminal domain-containing protein [Paracoccus thiocyanatus]RDW14728.1 dehydratase [Paracoccus thiocyanatus]